MDFRLHVEMPSSSLNIQRSDSIISLGSCFSQRIGERLEALKFNIDIDPFGVQYDPVSISNALLAIAEKKCVDALEEFNGNYFSFAHSTLFSSHDEHTALDHINKRIIGASNMLEVDPVVMLTLGTAWVFKHKERGLIVANCHKLPAKLFERELLTVAQVVDALRSAMLAVQKIAPNVRFVFTVSPVRHVRDGLINDQLGKSVLFVALHELRSHFPEAEYFPAFEILQHELRDHRFYAEDMAHPSEQATEYIWQQFERSMVDPAEQALSKEIQALRAAMKHKPFNAGSKEYQGFLKTQIDKLEKIASLHPGLDLSEMKVHFDMASAKTC